MLSSSSCCCSVAALGRFLIAMKEEERSKNRICYFPGSATEIGDRLESLLAAKNFRPLSVNQQRRWNFDSFAGRDGLLNSGERRAKVTMRILQHCAPLCLLRQSRCIFFALSLMSSRGEPTRRTSSAPRESGRECLFGRGRAHDGSSARLT